MTRQASQITYDDKVRKGTPGAVQGVTDTFRAQDANEIKRVVNDNGRLAEDAYALAEELSIAVNPFVVTLTKNQGSPQRIANSGTLQVKLDWTCKVAGEDVEVQSLQLSRGGTVLTTDASLRTFTDTIDVLSAPGTVIWTLQATYATGSQTKTATTSIQFTAASYYGVVANLAMTAEIAKSLTDATKNAKALTVTGINMNNQRYAYVYPKSYGALTSISDGVLPYLDSFTRTELQIDGIDYYAYVLTDPTTVTNFKFIFS